MKQPHTGQLRRAFAAVLVAATSVGVLPSVAAAAPPNDEFTVAEDASTMPLDVLANDGGSAAIDSFTPASNGTVGEVLENGVRTFLTYKPNADFFGEDTFTYTTAENGETTVTVTVEADNDQPQTVVDPLALQAVAEEDGPAVDITAELLANITDVDNDPDDLEVTSASTNVGVVQVTDGIVTYDATDDVAIEATISYTVSDGELDVSGDATLTITPVDDLPSLDEASHAPGDFGLNLFLNEGDAAQTYPVADLDDPDGNPPAISIVSVGEWFGQNEFPDDGSAEVIDGAIVYTPPSEAPGAASNVIEIFYSYDGVPGTGRVGFFLDGVDDAPVAENDTTSVAESGSVSIDATENDTDEEGDAITITGATITSEPAVGSVTVDETDNEVDYTHTGDSLDDVVIEYTINGGDTGEITVSVTNADDDAPVAASPVEMTVIEDSVDNPVTIPEIGTTDADDETITVDSIDDENTNGVVVLTETGIGYTPAADDDTTDSFDVVLTDGTAGDEVTVTVNVSITGENDAPVANTDYYDEQPERHYCDVYPWDCYDCPPWGCGDIFIMERAAFLGYEDSFVIYEDDGTYTLDLTANDTDVDGDDITILESSITEDDEYGIIGPIGSGDGERYYGSIVISSENPGAVEYTPAPNFSGSFSFDYVATDGELESEETTVFVYVVAQYDETDPEYDDVWMDEDTVEYFSVLENDSDPDYIVYDDYGPKLGDYDARVANREVSFGDEYGDRVSNHLSIVEVTQPANGFVAIAGDRLRVEPDPDFNGELYFEYAVQAEWDPDGYGGQIYCDEYLNSPDFDRADYEDGYGPCSLQWASVYVEVVPVNDGPTAENDSAVTDEDTAVSIDVLDNDVDPDHQVDECFIDDRLLFGEQLIFDGPISDGCCEYDEYCCPFEYCGLEITRVALLYDGEHGDHEYDSFGELEIARVVQPDNGVVGIVDGEVVYTPDPDFNGVDGFAYYVTDGEQTSIGFVDVTVEAVNDKPEILDETIELDENTSATFEVTVTDTETPVADMLISVKQLPEGWAGSADGTSITVTPAADFVGEETFRVRIEDTGDNGDDPKSDIAIISVKVNEVPDELPFDDEPVDEEPADEEPVDEEPVDEEPVDNPYEGAEGIEGEIVRLYEAMLNRSPDAEGFAYWNEVRTTGSDLSEMIAFFAASDEFLARFGDKLNEASDEEWVGFVYVELMQRDGDAEGQAYWLALIQSGDLSRTDLVVLFAQAPEFRNLTNTK